MSTISRIRLNDMSINEAMKSLTYNTLNDKFERYIYECENCDLSILTASHFNSSKAKTVEIAILYKDGGWFKMYDDEEGVDYDSDASIIHYMPLIGLPLLIKAFDKARIEDIPRLHELFDDVSMYC